MSRHTVLSACTLTLTASLFTPTATRAADAPPSPKLPLPPAANPPNLGRLTLDPHEPVPAQAHVMSGLPAVFNGLHLNPFLGADRFYAAGVTGQGTVATALEPGLIWNAHVTLPHVTSFTIGTGALGETDRHATAVGMVLGGRKYAVNPQNWQYGIAPDTDLRSAAIATRWNPASTGTPRYSVNFTMTGASLFSAAQAAFANSDVINNSWGFVEPTGTEPRAIGLDGLARAHPRTTFVTAAGNAGPGPNTVGGIAAGYNSIAVANLASPNAYDAVDPTSSRGPQDYSDPVRGVVPAARAPVDIAAPGNTITTAYYGGETGGNSPSLGGSPGGSPGSTTFYANFSGTSFAAPMVAGAAALLDSAARNTPALAPNPNARDARVVKAVLLNAATKTPGWDNGQSLVAGVVTTDRALDYAVGAGRLNLAAAYDQYLAGTTDLPDATATAAPATAAPEVAPIGWDFATVAPATVRDYVIADLLQGGTTLTATLAWFRDRTFTDAATVSDDAFRDLDLEVWDAAFTTLVAQSRTRFDNVEHLAFTLPQTGQYALRVRYFDTTFGTPADEGYAIAWSGTPIPEPSTLGPLLLTLPALLLRRRRRPLA